MDVSFRHAGLEEPAPYFDTGASRLRPDESREPSQSLDPGFHREPWIPAFAGMTAFYETVSLWTDTIYHLRTRDTDTCIKK